MTFPYQPGPTTAKIECSRSFLAVVGSLWVVDRWQQPPQSTKSNIHAHFQRFWVSFGCCYCHHLLPPPQLPESSTRAHFRQLLAFSSRCPYCPHQPPPQSVKMSICTRFHWLWAFSGRRHHHNPQNRAHMLIFGGCGFPLATTPENERSLSFSVVVGISLAAATMTPQN